MAGSKFKFEGLAEPPKPAPKEGYAHKAWRIATDPIVDSLGLKPALDEFAHAKADDGPISSRLKGFAAGALGAVTPGTLAEIATLPAMAAEAPIEASKWVTKVPGLVRTIKGLRTVAESVPAGAQAVSGIASGLQSAKGAIDTAKDVKEGNYGHAALDALGTTLGAVGARSGYKGYKTASKISKAMSDVSAQAGAAGQSGLRVAVHNLQNKPLGSDVLGDHVSSHDAARIAKMFPNGEPVTAPTTAEEVAQHAAIRDELKKNPGGSIAQAIFGEDGVPKGYFSSKEPGAPKEFSDTPVVPYSASEEAALAQRTKEAESFTKANTNAAAADVNLQAQVEEEARKTAQARINELNAGFKANADANAGLAKAEEIARKAGVKDDAQHAKNLNARDKYLANSNTQEARNRTVAEKYVQKYNEQEARNLNAKDKYTKGVEKTEDKATADALKAREAGFVQEARNENAREKFQRSVTKARADADAENLKRNAAAVAQAHADNQADTLDALKGTLTEVHEPTSINESITGPGEHGGTERATYRRTAPEPEEGEGGALGGGSPTGGSPKTPDPTYLHYTRASAVKEANRLGGPDKWDIIEPRKGVFKLTPRTETGVKADPADLEAMGLGGEPPAPTPPTDEVPPAPDPVPPTPDAPTPPPTPGGEGLAHLSPVEKESLFTRNMAKSEAETLAKHLGLEPTQVGPGNRNWRVKRPEGVEPYVEPPSAPTPSEPDGISSTFLKNTAKPTTPKAPQQPVARTPKELRDLAGNISRENEVRVGKGLPPLDESSSSFTSDAEKAIIRKHLGLPDKEPSVGADVTDYTAGDTPTVDVEPPVGDSGPEEPPAPAPVPSTPSPEGPMPPAGGAAPSGPEFEAYKKKYQDLYAKMMGAKSEDAQPHLNNLMDHFDENPAWGEHLTNNTPSVEPQVPDVAPHINPLGEAEPTLPNVPPVVNKAPAPIADLPYTLTGKSAKFAEVSGNDRTGDLFNDAHGDLPTDLNPTPNTGGELTAEELAKANIERANPKAQMKVERPAPIAPEAPPVDPGTKASVPFMITNAQKAQLREMGVTPAQYNKMTPVQAQELIAANAAQPQAPSIPEAAAAPEAPAIPEAPPVPEGGAIPARLFKSKTAHINDPEMGYPATQAALKAGELPTSPHAPVDSRGRPVNTARQQGATKFELNKAAQAPEAPAAPAEVPSAPNGGDEISALQAEIDSPHTDPITKQVLMRYLKNFMSEKGVGGGQAGVISPDLLTRMGGAVIGGAAGNQMDPFDNKTGSTAAGATTGFFAPELARGFNKMAPAVDRALGDSRESVANGAKFFNQVHNSALLSPLSVIKKAGGDIGGLSLAAMEHPERGGDILKQFLTHEGRGNIARNFREGVNGPEQESLGGLDLSGKLNSNYNPLSWSGKMMGGLTKATKGVLGESGFSAPEQRYYTLTDYPHYETTKNLYNGIRQGDFAKHLIPFARVGVNRLERGYEYSPFGLANKFMKTHAADPNIVRKAATGTAAGIAGYQLTPENFVKDHPIVASTGAALAGPLGLPVLAGMALKNAHRQPNDPYHILPDVSKLSDATGEIARDVPGLRLIEDASGKNPEGFARNYFSGYTNSTRPLALLNQYIQEGNTDDPDLSSKDLSEPEKLFNRTLSNIPGVRETLPKKKVSLTAPKFKFNF